MEIDENKNTKTQFQNKSPVRWTLAPFYTTLWLITNGKKSKAFLQLFTIIHSDQIHKYKTQTHQQ